MPQPRPDRAHEKQTLSFSVPRYLAEPIWAEIGEEYGAGAKWFRRVVQHWWDTRELREAFERERARRIQLEQALRKVQVATNGL